MADAEHDPNNIEGRMKALELGLGEMNARLSAIERALGIQASYQNRPPPIQTPRPFDATENMEPTRPYQPPPFPYGPREPAPTPAPGSLASAEEIEYRLGSKVLPWAGALILICAIGFFVSVGIERGWFNPAMQFVSALLASAGFIGVGFWKKEEREDFGKLLIGIGSCGFFLTFAAGNVFHKFYDGETLVALFLIWSALNLAFSFKDSSRAFLAIGLIGGLAAALMPLDKSNYSLNAILHFAVVLPALAIAARNRWSWGVVGVFAASVCALLPLAFESSHSLASLELRVFALFANTLAGCVAYGFAGSLKDFDPQAAFVPSMLVLTGLTALGIMKDLQHVGAEQWLYLLVFAGLSAGAGHAIADKAAKERFWIGAAILAAVITPLGLEDVAPAWAFVALAVGAAYLSTRAFAKFALAIGWIDLGLAGCFYCWRASVENPFRLELLLLLGLVVATLLLGWATHRADDATETIVSAVGVLLFAMIGRMAAVAALSPAINLHQVAAVVFVWVPLGVLYVALGAPKGWKIASALGWAGVLLAALIYFASLSSVAHGMGLELSELFLLVLGCVAGAAISAKHDESKAEVIVVCVGTLLYAFIGRMAAVVAASPAVDLPQFVAVILAWVPMGVALVGWSARRRMTGPLALGWLGILVSTFVYFVIENPEPLGYGLEASLLLLLIGGSIACGWLTSSVREAADGGLSVMTVLLWALLSRMSLHLLTLPSIGIERVWAVSIAWIALGAGLLAAGFWTDRRALRFWSFAVFGITVGKVFMVDLSEKIDPLVRVAILAGLGMALLAGGYWYIRSGRIGKPENHVQDS